MRNHRKEKKRLSSKDFQKMCDILLIETNKPLVSFNRLAKKETTRINQ